MAKTVKIEDLSTEKTIYYLKKEGEIKKKVKDYLDSLESEYPSASDGIKKVWNNEKTKKDWAEYSDKTGNWLEFIRYFTFEGAIIEGVKKDAKEKLDKLFTINDSDDDIKKSLKSQPTQGLKDDFEIDYKVDQIVWSVDLCEHFFLEKYYKIIGETLKIKGLTLSDLKEEDWKKNRENTFMHAHNAWKKTVDEVEIKNLETQLNKDADEFVGLAERTWNSLVEKYKKENSKGEPWDLTDEEKNKIERAPNKQKLEEVVKGLEKSYAERKESDKVNKWIKENISDKTKIEDLPNDLDIDNASEIPAQFKEEAKLKRWEKEIELTPKPTTVEGEIKQHLTEVLYKWKKWEFLTDNDKKDDKSYITALMFNEKFREGVAKEMKPKIEAAIKTNTLEGYRGLDKEWGEQYTVEREFLEAWSTLRRLLGRESASNYDKIKKHMTINYYDEERWKEIENEAQIEVIDKQG
jgi:hypothetical protein